MKARIPTLDGWRGIAILLVLFDHIQSSLAGDYLRPWTHTGQHGVTIFFVLSGFLITSKLIEGPIDLRRFYMRRLFRLMPVAWSYLAFVLLLAKLTGVHLTKSPDIPACIFFYRNYLKAGGWTGHFWSLSVEEQFYLAWPCILYIAGARRSRWVAVAGIVSIAAFRMHHWAQYDRMGVSDQTEVRADALLIGCLAAMLIRIPFVRAALGRIAAPLAVASALTLLACMARFHWLPPLTECIAIALLIVLSPRILLLDRALGWRPLAWLGIVSYSLYVWQEAFMHTGFGWGKILSLCLGLPIFALGSYYCIERPSTRLGHRLVRDQNELLYPPGTIRAREFAA